jgi:hypothetical protein
MDWAWSGLGVDLQWTLSGLKMVLECTKSGLGVDIEWTWGGLKVNLGGLGLDLAWVSFSVMLTVWYTSTFHDIVFTGDSD